MRLNFRYHPELVEWIKGIPGATWSPPVWLFPIELVPAVRQKAESLGYVTQTQPGCVMKEIPDTLGEEFLDTRLYPHQKRAVARATRSPAWLFNDEPGLGKTAQALASLRLLNVEFCTVVCPAQVRLTWFHPDRRGREIERWWGDAPPVSVWLPGKESMLRNINVVSYEMLGDYMESCRNAAWPMQALVFDEIHYLQNPRSRRSKLAEELVAMYPNSVRYGLTGTLITNNADSMGNPLNILYPGRFATAFRFAKRYSNAEHNGYGWEFKGLNVDHADELKYRLGLISSRTTKDDPLVAGLLPPFLPKPYFINPKDRVAEAVEVAEDRLRQGAKHIVILTHHVNLARDIMGRLDPARTVLITGEDAAEAKTRDELIDKASQVEGSIIVASLKSVMVGLNNMAFNDTVIVAEADSRPADMIQVLNRFHRLNSPGACEVILFCSEQGGDPMEEVANKIHDFSRVIKAGVSEAGINSVREVLKSGGFTKDEVDAFLTDMAANYTPPEF